MATALTADPKTVENVHAAATIIDMTSSANPAKATLPIDGKPMLDRAIEAGVTLCNVTVAGQNASFWDAATDMNMVYRLANQDERVILVETVADIERAKQEGKLGISLHFQSGTPFGDDLSNTVPVLHKLGLRVTQLTYNEHNKFGSGCLEPTDEGLTASGRQLVRLLNNTGIIVDISHWQENIDGGN